MVNVAAALTGAAFEAQQDRDEGWSWTHAALVDGGAALGGVVAGVGIGALAASAPVSVAVAAGVGGALLVGIGIDKAVHEHWSEDIHDHGVIGGLAHGSWDVAKATGKSIKDDAEGVWHGITSLF